MGYAHWTLLNGICLLDFAERASNGSVQRSFISEARSWLTKIKRIVFLHRKNSEQIIQYNYSEEIIQYNYSEEIIQYNYSEEIIHD